MALVVSDRIKETTTTTGTGTYTLAGAVNGFETFTANLSNADTTYYACTDGTDFEVGLGTFTSSGTTLARTTILASSNSNAAVSWSSGTRTIFCTLPAAKAVFKDGSDNINGTFVGNITGDVTGNADTASAVAADNISAGDAAINLTTTSGNITIDAQGNNTDIIFKGTDGGVDVTALTLEMGASARSVFGGGLKTPSYFWMSTDGNTAFYAGANFEIQLVHIHNTGFKLTNSGTGTPAVELQFVDSNEAIGSDGTNLKLTSGGNEITVPNSGADTMTLNAATQTLTNKTLTSPTINGFSGTGNASITGDLTLTSTDAAADDDPTLVLYRNSSSPADNDEIGEILFRGRNDNSQDVEYVKIGTRILDATDSSEDSRIAFQLRNNGSFQTRLTMGGNEDSTFAYEDLLLSTGVNLKFEGATYNATNKTTLTVVDPTAANTITLPDATGTVLTTGNSDTPTTTTSSADADFVLVDDGGTMKKITPANLGITSGSASKGFAVAMAIAL